MSERKVLDRECFRVLLEFAAAASLAVVLGLLPTTAASQVLYGSMTGTITDASGAAIPGATVTIKDEQTGLALIAVTDSTGTYNIRNITGGTYTLRAALQGFKEFVQTSIPVTAGSAVRINGELEIGALSESVTVTTEAALLKTDKADVSTQLKPADVVNLPLNQYRNYQYLMNLVPGATPPEFQNAQTDTPGRSLSVNVNGTNRNNNVTRIDGAASINVWLPHHAAYVAPVETIEVVNISTNSFDAAQGMTGGAAVTVQTKSGTNTLRGSAFYFRQQDELNARRGYFDPNKVDASTQIGPLVAQRQREMVEGYISSGRDEGAKLVTELYFGLEDWALGGLGRIEPMPAPGGKGYQVRAGVGRFVLIACDRIPGRPYQPAVFDTVSSALSAAERIIAILRPSPGAHQEVYFNTENFRK